MPHTLISGRTLSGKSAFAKQTGSRLRNHGYVVVAFNPNNELGYTEEDEYGCVAADYATNDPDEFHGLLLDVYKEHKGEPIHVIIDEAAKLIPHSSNEWEWITAQGRHFGFNVILICQRAVMLNPTVRNQCTRLFLFPCSKMDAKYYYDEYDAKELLGATKLKRCEYLYVDLAAEYKVVKGKV